MLSFWKDLSIKKKLVLPVCIQLLIVVIVGCLMYLNISETQQQSRQIADALSEADKTIIHEGASANLIVASLHGVINASE